MGTWTDEFVNMSRVTSFERAGEWIRTNVIAPIRAAVGREEVPYRNTVLYFPPGDWIFLLTAGSPLVLPPEVELRIAPGARLVTLGTSYLEIQGSLKAPIGPIFTTFATRPAGRTYFVSKVRLTGDNIERVYPEWWGAGVRRSGIFRDEAAVTDAQRNALYMDDEIDTEALEEALRAAVDRTPTGASSSSNPCCRVGTFRWQPHSSIAVSFVMAVHSEKPSCFRGRVCRL